MKVLKSSALFDLWLRAAPVENTEQIDEIMLAGYMSFINELEDVESKM